MAKLPELLLKVNKVADAKNPTDLEKKHIPVIEAPASVKPGEMFDVTVHVGKLLEHPNEPEHFIEYIELFAGWVPLVRVDLAAGVTQPKVVLRVAVEPEMLVDGGCLRAFEKCNKHGVWAGEKAIKVQ